MKYTLALTLALTAFSAVAQETMITELESGDKWLRVGFANGSQDIDLKSQLTGAKASEKTDSDIADISFIMALNPTNDFTPGLGFSVSKVEGEDDSAILFDVSAGGLFKTTDEQTYAVFGTFSSSDDDDVRDSLQLNMNVQTSSIGNSIYNEVAIDAEYDFKNNGTSGGHSVDISTRTRFSLNPKVEFEAFVGLALKTDTDMPEDITVSNDPEFTLGGQLNINLVNFTTVEVGVFKSFASGVVDYSGHKVDADVDTTVTAISLTTRI